MAWSTPPNNPHAIWAYNMTHRASLRIIVGSPVVGCILTLGISGNVSQLGQEQQIRQTTLTADIVLGNQPGVPFGVWTGGHLRVKQGSGSQDHDGRE